MTLGAGVVRAADAQLHLDRPALGQDERVVQGQLADAVAADLVTGLQRRARGTRCRAPATAPQHAVVGEPRVRPRRQAAGEHGSRRAAAGQRCADGVEQRRARLAAGQYRWCWKA